MVSSPWMMMYVTFVVFLGISLRIVNCQDDPLLVSTNLGEVRGHQRVSASGRMSTEFLGIPYAMPPVGLHRFQPPKPHTPWTNTLYAMNYGAACPQRHEVWRPMLGDWMYDNYIANLRYNEDCLTLNVVVPGEPRLYRTSPLPVMVWFHGGGLLSGSANFQLYEGNWLADLGQVIFVSVQYRLGVLGFFTTGSDEAPGNLGMFDQVLALKWVKENIQNFGGDPGRVTLFGQSAGAVSAGYHMLSPASEGLFHRVILQSGVPFGSAPSSEEMKTQAESLSLEVGCPVSDVSDMLECLRELPATELADLSLRYPFAVYHDGQFLMDDPNSLWKQGRFSHIPVLIGANSDDGNVFFLGDPSVFMYGVKKEDIDMIVSSALSMVHYTDHASILSTAIKSEYFHTTHNPLDNARSALDMFTDMWFLAPVQRTADALDENNVPVFKYFFDYRPSYLENDYDVTLGAGHGEELGLVFGAVSPDGILAANGSVLDQAFAFSMMRAWTSFASDGMPVYIDKNAHEQLWPPYNKENQTYVALSADMTENTVRGALRDRRMWFWNTLLPCLAQDEICPTTEETKMEHGFTDLSKKQVEILMLILGAFGLGMMILFILLLCCHCIKQSQKKGKTV